MTDDASPWVQARRSARLNPSIIREILKAAALREHLPAGSSFCAPTGGMFFWVRLPEGFDSFALLPHAVDAGIAFVPGAAFYAQAPDPRTLRLSFVTLTTVQIASAVRTLGELLARQA